MLVLLTLHDAAERLRVSERTVQREVAEGRIAVVKVGRSTRIHPEDLDRFVERQRAGSEVAVLPTVEAAVGG